MTAVQCQDLELRAGYKPLIRGFSLSLDFGESVAVIGPNGLGKTTLLRALCGVCRPYKGRVELDGRTVWPQATESSAVGLACYLSSHPALFPDHSVASNLEFYVRSHAGIWDPDAAFKTLQQVGLSHRLKQSARTLSTGQKRRLTLAFLLLSRPKILFLDEPTNGLDLEGVDLFLSSLTELKKSSGSSIVLATHDPKLIDWCGASVDLKRWAV